jgi:UDP-N-acetylglucosamine 2-epimerase
MKLSLILGTRTGIIKLAPIVRELEKTRASCKKFLEDLIFG